MVAVNPERKDQTWLYVGLAFFVAWFVVLQFYNPLRPSNAPRLVPGLDLGTADFSWKLHDLEGSPVELSSLKGKPIFLNIWATWCGPCVKEMPSIAKLAADPKLKGKGIAFVCVSVDDSPDSVKRFLTGKNWPMTVLHANGVPKVFETEGIPATYIIGPDGKIVASEVGSAEWDAPEVVSFLEKLAGDAR